MDNEPAEGAAKWVGPLSEGLITLASSYGQAQTIARVIAEVTQRGMTVFARIDHAAAATSVGLGMRPAEVIVFGNPKAGTPLMRSAPTLAIDLPLKVLVWQDEDGATWLSYNEPFWMAARHGLPATESPLARGMAEACSAIASRAAGQLGD